MTVWRLARAVYPALDGEGARLNGGRWNEPGTPIVYTAGSLSLAALEVLVHLNPDRLPDDLVAYGIALPTESLQARRVEMTELPDGWDRQAEGPGLRRIGETWAQERETPILDVPSAVIPEERNYLINPRHEAAANVRIDRQRPFDFDPKLFSTESPDEAHS